MRESARYAKIVEWSDEDQCFVGSCPGLRFGGCHGDDELTVFSKLCEEESIRLDEITDFINPPAAWGWLMEREEITLSKVRLISLDWMAGYGPNKYVDRKPGRAVALAYLQCKWPTPKPKKRA